MSSELLRRAAEKLRADAESGRRGALATADLLDEIARCAEARTTAEVIAELPAGAIRAPSGEAIAVAVARAVLREPDPERET